MTATTMPMYSTVLSLDPASFTVTVQDAVYPPSTVVTVTVAVPTATAFTAPLEETLRIEASLEFQMTPLLVASEG